MVWARNFRYQGLAVEDDLLRECKPSEVELLVAPLLQVEFPPPHDIKIPPTPTNIRYSNCGDYKIFGMLQFRGMGGSNIGDRRLQGSFTFQVDARYCLSWA